MRRTDAAGSATGVSGTLCTDYLSTSACVSRSRNGTANDPEDAAVEHRKYRCLIDGPSAVIRTFRTATTSVVPRSGSPALVRVATATRVRDT